MLKPTASKKLLSKPKVNATKIISDYGVLFISPALNSSQSQALYWLGVFLKKRIQLNVETGKKFFTSKKNVFIPGIEVVDYVKSPESCKNFGFIQPMLIKCGANLLGVNDYCDLVSYKPHFEMLTSEYLLHKKNSLSAYMVCIFLKANQFRLKNNSVGLVSVLNFKIVNANN